MAVPRLVPTQFGASSSNVAESAGAWLSLALHSGQGMGADARPRASGCGLRRLTLERAIATIGSMTGVPTRTSILLGRQPPAGQRLVCALPDPSLAQAGPGSNRRGDGHDRRHLGTTALDDYDEPTGQDRCPTRRRRWVLDTSATWTEVDQA